MNAQSALRILALAAVCAAVPSLVHAQPDAKPAPAAGPGSAGIPVQVQIVLTRYQGDKKVSSVPYSVAVKAGSGAPTLMRMGVQVPVPNTTLVPVPQKDGGGGAGPAMTSFNYREVGTRFDIRATPLDGGRFELSITLEDSSVYTDAKGTTPAAAGYPAFRTFSTTSTLFLRDGQTGEFTAATDRISDEVLKVDVTLRVVK